MIRTYSDQALLELVAQGSQLRESAFNVFYKRHNPPLKTYCYSKLRNKTFLKDVVQSTWEQFYSAVHDGRSIRYPRRYLIRIARNNIYRAHRTSNAAVHTPLEAERAEIIDESSDTLRLIAAKEIAENIEKYLSKMSPVSRTCMRLHWIDGHDYKEISEKTELPYECVRKRCERGINKLRDSVFVFAFYGFLFTPFME